MRHTNNRQHSLRWKLTSVLEDLDYADDVALISSRFADLQEKTDRLVAIAGIVGLKINPCKKKTLRMNHRCGDLARRPTSHLEIKRTGCATAWSQNVESDDKSHQIRPVSAHMTKESAEEILALPSEQFRAP